MKRTIIPNRAGERLEMPGVVTEYKLSPEELEKYRQMDNFKYVNSNGAAIRKPYVIRGKLW